MYSIQAAAKVAMKRNLLPKRELGTIPSANSARHTIHGLQMAPTFLAGNGVQQLSRIWKFTIDTLWSSLRFDQHAYPHRAL
jgi:hypothetical protein